MTRGLNFTHDACRPQQNEFDLVEVKERHHLVLLFGIPAGFEQRVAVMEGKTDQLLTAGNDFLVASGTGLG
jgi:hypothetical protein